MLQFETEIDLFLTQLYEISKFVCLQKWKCIDQIKDRENTDNSKNEYSTATTTANSYASTKTARTIFFISHSSHAKHTTQQNDK